MRRWPLVPLLALAPLACDDEPLPLVAGAEVTPELLDFGVVALDEERTRTVQIRSSGTSGIELVDAAVAGPVGHWRVTPSEAAQGTLPPGGTATLDVTFRACPAAWTDDRFDETFDLAACPAAPVDGTLVITTDAGSASMVTLAALPGLAPRPELLCPRSPGFACPDPDAELAPCPILQFGGVGLTEACDVPIEIVNRRNRGQATADLVVDGLELRARSVDSGLMLEGADAGFTVLRDGTAWVPSTAEPLVVPVPRGADEGRVRLTVRFSPKVQGLLRGDFADGAGLKLRSNGSELSAGVLAEGLFPRLSWSNLQFDPSPPAPVTMTDRIQVEGAGRLTIASMGFDPPAPALSFTPDLTGRTLQAGDEVEIAVTLAAGADVPMTVLRVVPEAPATTEGRIVITTRPVDGAVPACRVTPSMLDLGVSAGTPLTGTVRLESTGFADCVLDRVDVTGPNPNARAEFSVDLPRCAILPCSGLGIALCSPSEPGCARSSLDIPVTYLNQDLTTTDLAELRLSTNDALEPEKLVVLRAEDDPCLPPTPVIEVATDDLCAGRPVTLTAFTSLPGGRQTVATTIVDYQWSIAFGTGMTEFIPPNAVMTQFTPGGSGVYIVTLQALNDCGARSTTPAQLTLRVSDCN